MEFLDPQGGGSTSIQLIRASLFFDSQTSRPLVLFCGFPKVLLLVLILFTCMRYKLDCPPRLCFSLIIWRWNRLLRLILVSELLKLVSQTPDSTELWFAWCLKLVNGTRLPISFIPCTVYKLSVLCFDFCGLMSCQCLYTFLSLHPIQTSLHGCLMNVLCQCKKKKNRKNLMWSKKLELSPLLYPQFLHHHIKIHWNRFL